MKTLIKLFMILASIVVLGIVAVIVLVVLFAGNMVKKTVETFGPEITQVETVVEKVDLSLASGRGQLNGMKIGNPEGYAEDFAFYADAIAVDIDPASLLSDKFVINEILIKSPDLRFEQQGFSSNFNKILKNVEAYTSKMEDSDESNGFDKKIELKHFLMSGSKVTVNLSGSPVVISLPDIEFKNLGSGPEGITVSEVVTEVVSLVTAETLKSLLITPSITVEGEEDLANNLKKNADEVLDSLNELKDLFEGFDDLEKAPQDK